MKKTKYVIIGLGILALLCLVTMTASAGITYSERTHAIYVEGESATIYDIASDADVDAHCLWNLTPSGYMGQWQLNVSLQVNRSGRIHFSNISWLKLNNTNHTGDATPWVNITIDGLAYFNGTSRSDRMLITGWNSSVSKNETNVSTALTDFRPYIAINGTGVVGFSNCSIGYLGYPGQTKSRGESGLYFNRSATSGTDKACYIRNCEFDHMYYGLEILGTRWLNITHTYFNDSIAQGIFINESILVGWVKGNNYSQAIIDNVDINGVDYKVAGAGIHVCGAHNITMTNMNINNATWGVKVWNLNDSSLSNATFRDCNVSILLKEIGTTNFSARNEWRDINIGRPVHHANNSDLIIEDTVKQNYFTRVDFNDYSGEINDYAIHIEDAVNHMNFTECDFLNKRRAYYMDDASVAYNTVTGGTMNNMSLCAIHLAGVNRNNFSNIVGSAISGIGIYTIDKAGEFTSNNTFTSCTFNDASYGVMLLNNTRENNISHCTFVGADYHGVYCGNYTRNSNFYNNHVKNSGTHDWCINNTANATIMTEYAIFKKNDGGSVDYHNITTVLMNITTHTNGSTWGNYTQVDLKMKMLAGSGANLNITSKLDFTITAVSGGFTMFVGGLIAEKGYDMTFDGGILKSNEVANATGWISFSVPSGQLGWSTHQVGIVAYVAPAQGTDPSGGGSSGNPPPSITCYRCFNGEVQQNTLYGIDECPYDQGGWVSDRTKLPCYTPPAPPATIGDDGGAFGIPGFEFLALIGALGIAFIVVKRRKVL